MERIIKISSIKVFFKPSVKTAFETELFSEKWYIGPSMVLGTADNFCRGWWPTQSASFAGSKFIWEGC